MTNVADTETLLMFMVNDNYDKWVEILSNKREFITFISELSGFDSYEEIKQIRLGIENGLSVEQIKVYAEPKFSFMQMEKLRKAFEEGLTIEQVKLFALDDMDSSNMSVFVDAFKHNLSDSQIQHLLNVYRQSYIYFYRIERDFDEKNKRNYLRELLKREDCIYL